MIIKSYFTQTEILWNFSLTSILCIILFVICIIMVGSSIGLKLLYPCIQIYMIISICIMPTGYGH